MFTSVESPTMFTAVESSFFDIPLSFMETTMPSSTQLEITATPTVIPTFSLIEPFVSSSLLPFTLSEVLDASSSPIFTLPISMILTSTTEFPGAVIPTPSSVQVPMTIPSFATLDESSGIEMFTPTPDISSSTELLSITIAPSATTTLPVETLTIFLPPLSTMLSSDFTMFPSLSESISPSPTFIADSTDIFSITETVSLLVSDIDATATVASRLPSMEATPSVIPSAPSITSMVSFDFSTFLPTPSASLSQFTSSLFPSSSPIPSETPTPSDSQPLIVNPIGLYILDEGELFTINIPEDTFFDVEDGFTRNLSLTLLHVDGHPVENTSWVQLSNNPYTLTALPLASEVVNGTITIYQFLLQAQDSDGNNVTDTLTFRIIPRFGIQTATFVTVFVEGDFSQFMQNFTAKVTLSERITPPDPSSIYIKSFQNGSIGVTYTNVSIAFYDCMAFHAWFSTIYNSNSYTNTFRAKLLPYILIGQPNITGPCASRDAAVSFSLLPPTDGAILRMPFSLLTILIVIIVPTVALAFLLLLLGSLACILYRNRRREEKAGGYTFLDRRPVILPGEIEGVPYRYRKPIILTDELPRRVNRRGYLPLLHPSPTPTRPPPSAVTNPLEEEQSDDEELVDFPLITVRDTPIEDPPQYRLPYIDD